MTYTGTIIYVNTNDNVTDFGFIECEGLEEDEVFFYINECDFAPDVDMDVSFDITGGVNADDENDTNCEATSIQLVEEE